MLADWLPAWEWRTWVNEVVDVRLPTTLSFLVGMDKPR